MNATEQMTSVQETIKKEFLSMMKEMDEENTYENVEEVVSILLGDYNNTPYMEADVDSVLLSINPSEYEGCVEYVNDKLQKKLARRAEKQAKEENLLALWEKSLNKLYWEGSLPIQTIETSYATGGSTPRHITTGGFTPSPVRNHVETVEVIEFEGNLYRTKDIPTKKQFLAGVTGVEAFREA